MPEDPPILDLCCADCGARMREKTQVPWVTWLFTDPPTWHCADCEPAALAKYRADKAANAKP